jgi:hypothetical protein
LILQVYGGAVEETPRASVLNEYSGGAVRTIKPSEVAVESFIKNIINPEVKPVEKPYGFSAVKYVLQYFRFLWFRCLAYYNQLFYERGP